MPEERQMSPLGEAVADKMKDFIWDSKFLELDIEEQMVLLASMVSSVLISQAKPDCRKVVMAFFCSQLMSSVDVIGEYTDEFINSVKE